jgi:protein SCO1/2
MRKKMIVIMLTLLLSGVCLAKAETKNNGESVYNISTVWLNQDSQAFPLQKLKGRPVVLAMVYTSCQSACPLIVSDMKNIAKALSAKEKEKVQFALFSFDPEEDVPSQLKQFAKEQALDLTHWNLLTAQPDAVRELAAVLGVQYKKNASGEFSHSNIITILDAEGKIRYQQAGLKQDPKMSAQIISELLKTKK